MRIMLATALAAAVFLPILACAQRGEPLDDYVRRVEAWRAQHDADYRRDWVTIAGLHFLDEGRYTAGSDASNDLALTGSLPPHIGRFTVDADRVRFERAPDVAAQRNGEPVTAPVDLRAAGESPADELTIGDVRMAVHRSGARRGLRVWDPDGPLARGFLGFRWFDIDPEYRVIGRFIPDPEPRAAQVMNTFGDTDTFTTEGVVEFQLHGETFRLRPFTTRPDRFYFVFRDASSGEETYEAARFLYADLLDDGTAELDFNIAYNPPCAFNPHTTCPIPLRENVLPVKVLAGERAYGR